MPADDDVVEAEQHPAEVRDGPPQYEDLEGEQERADHRHVEGRVNPEIISLGDGIWWELVT